MSAEMQPGSSVGTHRWRTGDCFSNPSIQPTLPDIVNGLANLPRRLALWNFFRRSPNLPKIKMDMSARPRCVQSRLYAAVHRSLNIRVTKLRHRHDRTNGANGRNDCFPSGANIRTNSHNCAPAPPRHPSNPRPSRRPPMQPLQQRRHIEQSLLAKPRANQLQPHRQSVRGHPRRHRHRGIA